MTYRTAGRTHKTRKNNTRKTTKNRRTTRTARTAKTRTPKAGQAFAVPFGSNGTVDSAWYFGR